MHVEASNCVCQFVYSSRGIRVPTSLFLLPRVEIARSSGRVIILRTQFVGGYVLLVAGQKSPASGSQLRAADMRSLVLKMQKHP